MAFSASLRNDHLEVEAGSSWPLTVDVTNKGTEPERVELQIEGIDAEWTAVPVPVLDAPVGETVSAKIFLKPPRVSESLAGNYPFVLSVRSLESGEVRPLQGVLKIKPYHHLSAEISPKKGVYSATQRSNTFTVTLVNMGNTEHTLQLQGNDPEDACTFDFSAEQVTLGPGHQRDVEVVASPSSKPIVSGSRLVGLSVTARSITAPQVVATAQAQLEQRPLLTPISLITFLLAASLLALWIFTLPKPPTAEISVNPRSATVGQELRIEWSAKNATAIEVMVDGTVVVDSKEVVGSITHRVLQEGVLVVSAVARRDAKRGDPVEVRIPILSREVAPEPLISRIEVTPKTLRLGEPFVLRYAFNEAVVKASLSPNGLDLDLRLNQVEVTPQRSGKLDYEVVAENKDGKLVRRAFSVEVVDKSDAAILAFSSDSPRVPAGGGPVSVTWQVTNSARVELEVGGSNQRMLLGPEGNTVVNIAQKTQLKLIAYDERGRASSRVILIEVDQEGGTTPPLDSPPPISPPGDQSKTSGQ